MTTTLPPLPSAEHSWFKWTDEFEQVMTAYGAQCFQAGREDMREEAAKVCEEWITREGSPILQQPYKGHRTWEECAAAIRSLK